MSTSETITFPCTVGSCNCTYYLPLPEQGQIPGGPGEKCQKCDHLRTEHEGTDF